MAEFRSPEELVSYVQEQYSSGYRLVMAGVAIDRAVTGANLRDLASRVASKIGINLDISSDPQQMALLANYGEIGPRLERWGTVQLDWARRGMRDDGTPFSMAQWIAQGTMWLDAIQAQTGLVWDSSAVAIFVRTAAKTAEDVANPMKWPWWLQLAAGSIVVYYGAKVVGAVGSARKVLK